MNHTASDDYELHARQVGADARPRLRFDGAEALDAWRHLGHSEAEPASMSSIRRRRADRTHAGAPLLDVKREAA